MDDFEHRVHVDSGRVRYPGQEAIARLRAEVESLKAKLAEYSRANDRIVAELRECDREVEALRADADDAARYRYVRDLGDPQWFAQLLEQRDNFEVDAAIDAAIKSGLK